MQKSYKTRNSLILYKWFFEPVYKINYYYVICKDQQDFLDILKKHYQIDDVPLTEGCYGKSVTLQSNGKIVQAIWVKTKKSFPEFTHELLHALIGLFETIDHPLKVDNDEPIAYLAEYLMKQFIDKKDWKVFKKKVKMMEKK